MADQAGPRAEERRVSAAGRTPSGVHTTAAATFVDDAPLTAQTSGTARPSHAMGPLSPTDVDITDSNPSNGIRGPAFAELLGESDADLLEIPGASTNYHNRADASQSAAAASGQGLGDEGPLDGIPLLEEWVVDIYTATMVLWYWEQDPLQSEASFIPVTRRRLTLAAATVFCLGLQVIVPTMLIAGLQLRDVQLYSFPSCHEDYEPEKDGLCYESRADRGAAVFQWLMTLTVVLMAVSAQQYVDAVRTVRVLIEIHHFSLKGSRGFWGPAVVGVVQLWTTTVNLFFTYFVLTRESDPGKTSPQIIDLLVTAMALIFLGQLNYFTYKALVAASEAQREGRKIFPSHREIQKALTFKGHPLAPQRRPSTLALENLSSRAIYRASLVITDLVFSACLVFSIFAAFISWGTDCFNEEAFEGMSFYEMRTCNIWWKCKSDFPRFCSYCYYKLDGEATYWDGCPDYLKSVGQ